MNRRGFTLIEVLLVTALVVVFIGGAGLAWRGSGRAVGLQTGQAMLAGLVAAARSTAAATGRNAALLAFAASEQPGDVLCRFVVATRNPDDSAWVPVDDWIGLPAGVALLPPLVPAGIAIRDGDDWTGLRSHALSTGTEICDDVPCHVLAFTPRGTVMGLGGALIVAPVAALPPGEGAPWRYEQPEAVRGILVSSYGQVIAVETRSGF